MFYFLSQHPVYVSVVANTIHAFVYTCNTLIVQSTYMIPIRVLLNVITLVHRMQSEVSTLLQCLINRFLKRSYQKYSNYQKGRSFM